MKVTIDTDEQLLLVATEDQTSTLPLYSKDAFEIISHQWVRVGWDQKYAYTFTWMGLPVTQLPEDLLRLQEVIVHLQPDVILETGISRGGSLAFYASLCKMMGKGRVIGIDNNLWKASREAIQSHPLNAYITLMEGNSVDPDIIAKVKASIDEHESVLVILDSDHSTEHMLSELEAYHTLIKPGFYMIATDGIMKDVADVPRANPDWQWNNAEAATEAFCSTHPEFVVEQPSWVFNKSPLSQNISQWPKGWIKRKEENLP